MLLYAGDSDPSGEDIPRDLDERLNGALQVERFALTAEQVEQHDLPPQPGKTTDARAAAFRRRHGRLVQVELAALPPNELRTLYGGGNVIGIRHRRLRSVESAMLASEEGDAFESSPVRSASGTQSHKACDDRSPGRFAD